MSVVSPPLLCMEPKGAIKAQIHACLVKQKKKHSFLTYYMEKSERSTGHPNTARLHICIPMVLQDYIIAPSMGPGLTQYSETTDCMNEILFQYNAHQLILCSEMRVGFTKAISAHRHVKLWSPGFIS